jgi:hypothetical protein
MELINFIFRLGVLFAIYGFIWGIIEIGISLINVGRKRSMGEEYLIKGVKYILLVDVTFLFCLNLENNVISLYNLAMAGMVLLTYFIGKLQNQQNQQAMFKMMGNGLPKAMNNFNFKAEIGVIVLAIAFFFSLIYFPNLAKNPISNWLNESILNIEDTPIFGFIFKVIGFFFLLNMIMKMINGFTFLLSGKPFIQASSSFQNFRNKKDDDDFDDFEELK